MIKNPPANAEDTGDVGLIPGSGRTPAEGNGNPLQYSCLKSPMDRGARQATVHVVAKESDTAQWLKQARETHRTAHGGTQASLWSLLLLKHSRFFCLLTFPELAPIPTPGMSFLSVHLLTTIHLTSSLGSNSQEQGSDWLSIRSGVHAWSNQLCWQATGHGTVSCLRVHGL